MKSLCVLYEEKYNNNEFQASTLIYNYESLLRDMLFYIPDIQSYFE